MTDRLTLGTRIVRKLTVRPIRAMEAHYWYPIRKRAAQLPPLRSPFDADDGVLLILTTPESYLDAIWSAWSYLWQNLGSFRLVIACDGPPGADLIDLANRVLPGSEVIDARRYLSRRRRVVPAALLERHPLMTKLDLVLAMQESSPVLYSDSDVLMLNDPWEIRERLSARRDELFHLRGEASCEDPWVSARASMLGCAFDPHLNSGMMWLPQNSLDTALAREILDGWHEVSLNHFTEQSTLAALLAHAGATPLPEDRYVANAQRMFYFERDVDYDEIASRHFVNLIRNLMYSRGLPLIWRQARLAAAQQA